MPYYRFYDIDQNFKAKDVIVRTTIDPATNDYKDDLPLQSDGTPDSSGGRIQGIASTNDEQLKISDYVTVVAGRMTWHGEKMVSLWRWAECPWYLLGPNDIIEVGDRFVNIGYFVESDSVDHKAIEHAFSGHDFECKLGDGFIGKPVAYLNKAAGEEAYRHVSKAGGMVAEKTRLPGCPLFAEEAPLP